MVKFAHSNLSNFEKNIVFHHFGGKQEEKLVCWLFEKSEGVPFVPKHKQTYLLTMLVFVLFIWGNVMEG
jgi:hypothetical protein